MKKILSLLAILLIAGYSFAQNTTASKVYKNRLPEISVTKDVNLHFRSPEPIQFVDLSTNKLIGDLPAENVVRIKIRDFEKSDVKDSLKINELHPINYAHNEELGIVTIVGQSFMAQYKLVFKNNNDNLEVISNIEVLPQDMQPLEFPNFQMSNAELRKYAVQMFEQKENKAIRKNKDLGLISRLNKVFTFGDYVFLDVSFKNKTNLVYDIDKLKFSIDDKKIYKATNVQSVEIEPVFQLYHLKRFRKSYRNIFVFKKFTYPNNKVLKIRLIENQISGRTINLEVQYSDILQADTF